MITQFTIENYKSFRDPATIDFAAGTSRRLSGNLLRHPNGERFVKSMGLYGANASGKTTIIDALFSLREFVLFSCKDQKPTEQISHFEPFALEQEWSRRPARITLTIELNHDRYTLDVSATADRVWNESLTVQHMTKQPSRKTPAKLLVERKWDPGRKKYFARLDEALGLEQTRSAVIEQTTPNRLMLGKLAALNNQVASCIVQWFDDDLEFYDMHRNPYSEDAMLEKASRLYSQDEDFAAIIERLVKDADTGICELRVVNEKVRRVIVSEPDHHVDFKESTRPGLSFRHSTKDGSEVLFRRQKESSGTLRFVALLAAILQPSERRRLVCVDELSASLHPDLLSRLIRVVHSGRYNTLGTQLLFTTHDTHLIDPRDLLRRDQVTLCSKNRFGRSTTTRLDVFEDDARSDANLQKQYLEGRFGGLPQFGPSLEDVPVDDEPLEVAP